MWVFGMGVSCVMVMIVVMIVMMVMPVVMVVVMVGSLKPAHAGAEIFAERAIRHI